MCLPGVAVVPVGGRSRRFSCTNTHARLQCCQSVQLCRYILWATSSDSPSFLPSRPLILHLAAEVYTPACTLEMDFTLCSEKTKKNQGIMVMKTVWFRWLLGHSFLYLSHVIQLKSEPNLGRKQTYSQCDSLRNAVYVFRFVLNTLIN